jgi:hypothetical protein
MNLHHVGRSVESHRRYTAPATLRHARRVVPVGRPAAPRSPPPCHAVRHLRPGVACILGIGHRSVVYTPLLLVAMHICRQNRRSKLLLDSQTTGSVGEIRLPSVHKPRSGASEGVVRETHSYTGIVSRCVEQQRAPLDSLLQIGNLSILWIPKPSS